MSRTYIPPMGRIRKEASLKLVLQDVYNEFEMAYGDYDKCGDMADFEYYSGKVDALWDILHAWTETGNPAGGGSPLRVPALAGKTRLLMRVNPLNLRRIIMPDTIETPDVTLPDVPVPSPETLSKVKLSLGTAIAVAGVLLLVNDQVKRFSRRKSEKVVVVEPTATA